MARAATTNMLSTLELSSPQSAQDEDSNPRLELTAGLTAPEHVYRKCALARSSIA